MPEMRFVEKKILTSNWKHVKISWGGKRKSPKIITKQSQENCYLGFDYFDEMYFCRNIYIYIYIYIFINYLDSRKYLIYLMLDV